MAEPIPSASNAGETGEDDSANNIPKNAEDRKAAAALNALNANEMSQDSGDSTAKKRSGIDQAALDKAMSRLEIASGVSKKKEETKKAEVKKEAEVKKKIKIATDDVNFLVTELDLSRNKATELLRASEGNANQAIRSFINSSLKT